jgi:hypothetical protein
VRECDDYAASRISLLPLDASPGLLCYQHHESRPKANPQIFGAPYTIVLNDDDKISRPFSQLDVDGPAALIRKGVLQCVGCQSLKISRTRIACRESMLTFSQSTRSAIGLTSRSASPNL